MHDDDFALEDMKSIGDCLVFKYNFPPKCNLFHLIAHPESSNLPVRRVFSISILFWMGVKSRVRGVKLSSRKVGVMIIGQG